MRRWVLVLSALVAVIALAVGSAGFSSTSADRGVSVQAADDEGAFLSLQYSNESISHPEGDRKAVTFVIVENQFTEKVNVTVDYTVMAPDDSTESRGSASKDDLVSGETFGVPTTFICDPDGEYTIAFDATAQSDSLSVETTTRRTVTYTATCT